MNPYAQAGWSTNSNSGRSTHIPHAQPSPTFGMLPFNNVEASPHWITYTFTSLDEDILDCSVVGPNSQSIMTISTTPRADGICITTFTTPDEISFAQIEWTREPSVEVKNCISKRKAAEWITQSLVSPRARNMPILSEEYIWERYKESLYLYKPSGKGDNEHTLVARFYRADTDLLLQVKPRSMWQGILGPSIVALMLLTEHYPPTSQ